MITCIWYALGVRYAAARLAPAMPAALPLGTLALILSRAQSSAAGADCAAHTGTIFEQFGRAVLTSLPAKAPRVMLLTHGDEVSGAPPPLGAGSAGARLGLSLSLSEVRLLTCLLTYLLTYLHAYSLTYSLTSATRCSTRFATCTASFAFGRGRWSSTSITYNSTGALTMKFELNE